MKPLLKTGLFLCMFFTIALVSGYLTLKLIVRSGDVVVVPDLVGKDVVYALEILTELGLNTKVSSFEYRTDVPKNHVAHQQPAAGAEIKKGRDVRIILSKGPKTLVMPNLVGIDIREAKIIIEENGLLPGTISKTYSKGTVTGEVIAQTPLAGTVVQRGEAIDLLIGLGKHPTILKMPHLKGLSTENAILLLDRSHLKVGQIQSVQRDNVPPDTVVEQKPLSGYPVLAGSLVHLTVNRAKKGPILHQGLYLFHHRVCHGFLKSHVRLRINAFGVAYDLYDAFEAPGKDIWLITPEYPEATFFVYEDGELIPSPSITFRYEEPFFWKFEIQCPISFTK
ncbi:MAG: PASTA domain-containing protein [Deltaproteobacteria bacterium]|nr:PASTA domain-containing protein [Deltaproteobacteria bacterium]RLC11041.1 MAG: hypothetical protein DRH43_05030 [Deltaproteobacteria bacterium]